MKLINTEYPQFFTATNLNWIRLLKPEKYKNIIINSLKFLTEENRIKIYSFVIMDNHLHLIWKILNGIKGADLQRDFLKFTAQQIQKDLKMNNPSLLARLKVNAADRTFQFWERNPLSVEIRSEKVFKQKMDYIHYNPVKAFICKEPEEYKYSSAKFYFKEIDEWGFITH